MNIVVQRKEELSGNNYILHPERARAYWANISGGRVKEYLDRCGEAFNIVIVGNSAATCDFYAIPYGVLKSALVDEYRSGDKTGRVRWVAYILHHQLKVGSWDSPSDRRWSLLRERCSPNKSRRSRSGLRSRCERLRDREPKDRDRTTAATVGVPQTGHAELRGPVLSDRNQ